jgi:hypothetical protein
MFVKTIICFANSRKNGNRCVAGKTWSDTGKGQWLRPVGRDRSRALTRSSLSYQNGMEPTPLDIVEVPLEGALPEGHQRENVLANDRFYWTMVGKLRWAEIGQWLDTPKQLWALGDSSTGMLNNRVHATTPVSSSLQLIAVKSLVVKLVHSPLQNYADRHVVVGEFCYQGICYRIHVTDPLMEARSFALQGRQLKIDNAVLCMSLGACFQQHHYKLIAGVIYEGRCA